MDLLDLHEVFHPWDEDVRYDYWKMYADDNSWHEGFADAYGAYGIDRKAGCLVVCRPDQHVGLICGVDELKCGRGVFQRDLDSEVRYPGKTEALKWTCGLG